MQSVLPEEKSEKESNAVGEIIEEIIPPETPVGGYVQKNLRKIAHFVEFFVLGAEISLYALLFMPKTKRLLLTQPLGLTLSLIDETIQIFSDRGPEIVDVWIDYFGFVASSIIVLAIYCAACYVRKNVNKNSHN